MKIIPMAIALTIISFGDHALADTTDECQQLKDAQIILSQLQATLQAAEAAADPDVRIHFRYDWLRRDLAVIRRGIQTHLDSANCLPTTTPRVRGDYRR